jgi:hypothetical protein
MTQRDFCYWFQGFFEIGGVPADFTDGQRVILRKHLDLVEATEPSAPLMGWMRGAFDSMAKPQTFANRLKQEFQHVIDKTFKNSDLLDKIHGGTYRC